MEFWEIPAEAGDLGDLLGNLGKSRSHFEAGETSVPGMGFPLREGAGPEGHHGVPDEFVDNAVIPSNDLGSRSEVSVEEPNHGVGGQLFPDPAETGNIGEEDGDLPALGRLAEFARYGIDDIGHNAGIKELAKRIPEFFL
jgi:hypothetical protein